MKIDDLPKTGKMRRDAFISKGADCCWSCMKIIKLSKGCGKHGARKKRKHRD